MTDKDRELFEKALEALERSETTVQYEGFGMARRDAERKHQAAIEALKAALAEPVQEPVQDDLIPPDSLFVCGQMGANVTRVRLAEPVQEPLAWFRYETVYEYRNQLARCTKDCIGAFPVYTTPPRREWVGLTEEEIEMACVPLGAAMLSFTEVARAIEAALREKNNG